MAIEPLAVYITLKANKCTTQLCLITLLELLYIQILCKF